MSPLALSRHPLSSISVFIIRLYIWSRIWSLNIQRSVFVFCFFFALFLLTHHYVLHHCLWFLYCRALAGPFKQRGWTWLLWVSSDRLTKNKNKITGTLPQGGFYMITQCHIKRRDHPFVMGPLLFFLLWWWWSCNCQVKVTFTEECAAQSLRVKL